MAKHKILVVDDDETLRNSMESALLQDNFDVITANDGKDALAKAVNEIPDLIVTDVEMPVLDGMMMMKELRSSGEWGKKVPVIILTNYDTDENLLQGIIESEPSYYFLKSKVTPSMIIEKINEKLKIGI